MHQELAEVIVASGMDKVVLVGEESKKYIINPVREAYGDRAFHCLSSKIAGKKVREFIQASEKPVIVFVK